MSDSAYIRERKTDEGSGKRDLSYPPAPEALPVGIYDNHTHLEIADGENPIHYLEHLDLAEQAGMLGAVQVGVTLESSRWSAQDFSGVLAACQAQRMGVPFLGEVPLHMSIRENSDAGRPPVAVDPDGPHAAVYKEIAGRVMDALGQGAANRAFPRIVIE